jgi:hypothetical protein
MVRTAKTLLMGALAAGLLSGCSLIRPPKYYEQTKEFTVERLEDSRSFLERHLERDELVRVQPWERDLLSKPEMQWVPDPLEATRRNHIFFSKESSLGGGGTGGGGCGCN